LLASDMRPQMSKNTPPSRSKPIGPFNLIEMT
jgi:hypothetical protein